MKRLPAVLLALGFSFSSVCLSADPNAAADFTIGTTVLAPAPERYGVNIVHETELNNRGRDPGFEPMALRIKGTATAGGADYVTNTGTQNTSFYNTLGDGFFDGATIRIYRLNGTTNRYELLRRNTITSYHTDGYRRVLVAPVSGTTFTDTGLTPGVAYTYVVRSVDTSGNRSGVSAAVMATAAPGTTAAQTPATFTGTFFQRDFTAAAAPANVSATAAPGAVTLNWTAPTDTDLAGYWIYRKSIAPAEENRIYITSGPDDPPVAADDIYFIDHQSLNAPFQFANGRLTPNEIWSLRCGNSWPYGQPATKTRVRHPVAGALGLPDDAGQSCLRFDTSGNQEVSIRQRIFTDPTGYLGSLYPDRTYRVSVWLRQEGVPSGGVRFRLTADYSAADTTFTGVDGTWRKYEWTLPQIAYPTGANGTVEAVLSFVGPGAVWVDNFSIHEVAQPAFAFLADSRQAIIDYAPGSIRIRCGETDAKLGTFLDDITGPDTSARIQWGALQGGETYFDYNCTLPTALPLCMDSGATPWIVVGPYFDEDEWRGLIEYLAAPYDPAANPGTDTPELKPWAYKRYLQRGGSTRTWVDEFPKLRLEYGNEMWNSPTFDPWVFPAATYGRIAEHFFGTAKASTYFTPEVAAKIEFVLNGQLPSASTGGFGPTAKQQSPSANIVDFGAYIGGFDAGIEIGGGAFTDQGLQDYMMFGPTALRQSVDTQVSTRDQLDAPGHTYRLANYEAGPGYELPTPQTVFDPVQELYGKSLAAGVATLDLFLYGSSRGVDPQLFFCLNRYYNWSSHSLRSAGYRPHTAWLAMQMRNRFASGAMLDTSTHSTPTRDVEAWVSRNNTTYPASPSTPLVVPYAMRDGNTYSIFVISRKVTGDTPVTLRLPFSSVTGGTRYTLTGDPRANNATAGVIDIAQSRITDFSPVYSFAMPPGSAYLLVFEGASTPATGNPACTISRAVGQESPTSGAVNFTVTFSEPVTGFTGTDVVLAGDSGASTVTVTEAEPKVGTRFVVAVTGMTRSGPVSISVPADAAQSAGGQGNSASVALDGAVQYQFVDTLLAWDPFDLSPAAASFPPFLQNVSTGTGFSAAWQLASFSAATYLDGYKLVDTSVPAVTRLRSTGSFVRGGLGFTVAARVFDSSAAPFALFRAAGVTPTALGADGTTLWLSAVMRKDSADNDRALLFLGNTSNLSLGGAMVAMGYGGSGTSALSGGVRYWSLQVRNAANNGFDFVRTNVPVVNGQAVLLVLKLSFGAQDRFDLFVNPSSLGGEAPAVPAASWTTTGATNITFQGLGFAAGVTGSNQSSLDEIRLGNSFAAVTPDAGVLSFSSSGLEAQEGSIPTTKAVAVQRTGGSSGPVSVACATDLTGSAVPGTHYTPASTTLSWSDGDAAEKMLLLNLLSPDSVDGDVSVHLALATPQGGASLGTPSTATLLVHDSLFDQWRGANFGGQAMTNTGLAAADFDGDGIPNLVEYAFGSNPAQPGQTTPTLAIEGGYLTLTVNRSMDMPADVTWRAEVSSDLATWQSGPSFTTTVTDNASILKVRDNLPAGNGPRRFLRLRLSRP